MQHHTQTSTLILPTHIFFDQNDTHRVIYQPHTCTYFCKLLYFLQKLPCQNKKTFHSMASMTAVNHTKTHIEHDEEQFTLKRTTTSGIKRTKSRLIITESLEWKEIGASIEKRQCNIQPTTEIEKTYHACFQLHHVIPQHMWKDAIGQQLEKLEINKDDEINIVSLPTTRNIPDIIKDITTPSKPHMKFAERATTSSIHSGKHLNSYFEHILTNITEILDLSIDLNESIEKIKKFILDTKEDLLNGALKLQNEQQQELVCSQYNNKFIFIRGEFQAHHIIPQEIFNDETQQFKSDNFKSLKDGLKFVEFEKHDIQNLIALPKANALSEKSSNMLTPMKRRKSTDRTVHNGSHPKYTEDVKNNVIAIFKDLEQELASDPEDIESYKEAAHEELISLAKNLEQRLINGEQFDKWGEQPENQIIRSSTTNSPTLLKEDSKILTFDDSTLEIVQTTTD